MPEGKGENDFAFEGRWLGLATTLDIIANTHALWASVVAAKPTGKKAPWVPALPPHGASRDTAASAAFTELGSTTTL